jgi:lauroyl/myristoyl acyltransferase
MIRLRLFAAGVRLAEWLPPRLVYGLARSTGWLLSFLPTAPRRGLRANLRVVLGRQADTRTLDRLIRRAYQHQANNYADLLRARRITPETATRQTVPGGDGWADFLRAQSEGRGLILITAHFGRFEMMTHYVASLGLRLTLPVERLQPPALFDLLCRLRRRPTFTLVAADLGLRPCLRALQRGDAVVLFADWDSTGHGVPVRLFGATARLPAGPALLAVRTGVPIFPGFALPGERRGHVRATVDPPIIVERTGDFDADVQRATQLIANAIEGHIRDYPDLWVMFHQIWPDATSQAPDAAGRLPQTAWVLRRSGAGGQSV